MTYVGNIFWRSMVSSIGYGTTTMIFSGDDDDFSGAVQPL